MGCGSASRRADILRQVGWVDEQEVRWCQRAVSRRLCAPAAEITNWKTTHSLDMPFFSSSCCATACQSDWDTTQEWKSQCRTSLQISLILVWISLSWWGGNKLFIDPQTFILHPAASPLLLSSLLQTAKVRLMHYRTWHKWLSWPLVNSHGPVNLERVQRRGRNDPSLAAWAVQTVQ